MNPIFQTISNIGVVPVMKVPPEKAVDLSRALLSGGIPLAEITFRAEGASSSIAAVRKNIPDMLVGAGTVLTIEQADQALNAGAQFIVTPGFGPKVVEHCLKSGMPIMPGCSCATDIEMALSFGLDTVKFFPAEQSGGLAKIKALCGPYANIRFVPTGGINLANLSDYLSYDRVLACGGTFMAKDSYIQNEEWDEITKLCKTVVNTVLDFSLGHVGINAPEPNDFSYIAERLGSIMRMPLNKGESAIFVGESVEVMKTPTNGSYGHIAINTSSVSRARYYMEREGHVFLEESAVYDAQGRLKLIYLKEELAGFAVHLRQR